MKTLRIAMAQMNPTVGDLDGNVRQILSWVREAKKTKVDLVVFPELAITGYHPEDLLLKPWFVEESRRALQEVIPTCEGLAAILGCVGQDEKRDSMSSKSASCFADPSTLYNTAALIADGKLIGSYRKRSLVNHGIFDESRYFQPGQQRPLLHVDGVLIGVTLCEDIENSNGLIRRQAAGGAEVIVNINAAPFHRGKSRSREQFLAARARENRVIVAYTNMVGGQDELVFDGNSLLLDRTGGVLARGAAFQEELVVADVNMEVVSSRRLTRRRQARGAKIICADLARVSVKLSRKEPPRPPLEPVVTKPLEDIEEIYGALVMAVRDYVRKNGFARAALGLSGGVDSALTAAVAVDALGADRVRGVFLPSPYTSRASEEDVKELVQRLGIELSVISITPTFEAYLLSLAPVFGDRGVDATEENLQARIRGTMLMAMSNKFGDLVLTTGNKSELSVGYSTLYGDMAGGFAVIKDVPKTMVYALATFRNGRGPFPVIPTRTLERPPSAELRPDQKDEDSLPPYSILDPILQAYIEEDRSPEDIIKAGFNRTTVARVIQMVDRSEFKRHQAPIGVKITPRALGKDRRMPITNGYRRP